MAKEKKNKKEKFGNCNGCNKPIKKVRRYYRNGKYFCTKRCFQKYLTKSESPKDAA